jgi:hypothetical protein
MQQLTFQELNPRFDAILPFMGGVDEPSRRGFITMKLIPLSQQGKHKGKYFAQVDDDMFDQLIKIRWSATRHKSSKTIYAQTVQCKGKTIPMHRMIMMVTDPKIWVDHKDRDGLNNQKSNLRIATRSQNKVNTLPSGKSKYMGVCWNKKDKRWQAAVVKDGVTYYVGQFKDEKMAALAYDAKAKELHGDFANLNFPNE